MSTLVADAIARAGLADIASARHEGDFARIEAQLETLRAADLLALGALADRVRKDEVGDIVRVYTNAMPEAGPDVVDMHAAGLEAKAGIAFLRAVAIGRITGPRAAKVRVDWSKIGLELAQVALGFGASELVGPISSKRGLAIADSAEKKVKGQGMVSLQKMKQQEIAGLVRQAGRRVVIVGAKGIEIEMSEPEPVILEPMESQDV
jgi:2-iminoacetate synthase ThiH